MFRLRRQARPGFTLTELIIVLAILAVVTALLMVGVQRAREAACRVGCASNLKDLASAVHNYTLTNGQLPYSTVGGKYGWGPDSTAWSFFARMLPYVEQKNVYNQGQIDGRTLRASGVAQMTIPLFLCPSDTNRNKSPFTDRGNLEGFAVGVSNYKGVSGSNWGYDSSQKLEFPTDWRHIGTNGSYDGLQSGDGIFYRTDYQRPLRWQDITDGMSNTFMIGEDLPTESLWCVWSYANKPFGTCAIPPNVQKPGGGDYPIGDWYNRHGFRSRHSGGVQFAYADGSVHFIQNSISLDVYRAMATIQGGEKVTSP